MANLNPGKTPPEPFMDKSLCPVCGGPVKVCADLARSKKS